MALTDLEIVSYAFVVIFLLFLIDGLRK